MVEADALTVTDTKARVVAIVPQNREVRFANLKEPELTKLRQAVDQLNPPGRAVTLSMDRLIACLNPASQPTQKAVEVNLDPPRIFSSSTPAILVIFMGEPQLKPVETNRTDLLFALNTNWDVLYDVATQTILPFVWRRLANHGRPVQGSLDTCPGAAGLDSGAAEHGELG